MVELADRDLRSLRRYVGYLPDRQRCTSQVELDAEHRRLWVRLASVTRFSVSLDAEAVGMLIETLEQGTVCAVPCRREDRVRWLLGAGPPTEPGMLPLFERAANIDYAGGPMRLSLDYPDERIEIVFTPAVVTGLVEHLQLCVDVMVP